MRFVVVNSCPKTIHAFKNGFQEINKSLPQRIGLQCFQGNLAQYVDSHSCPSNKKIAVVSPANSLSFMGGGFDRGIAELLSGGESYRNFEAVVQNHLLLEHNGFIPPHSASIVDLKKVFGEAGVELLGSPKVTHLVQVPTMAVPEDITYSTVFYCMWNTLLEVDGKFDIVIVPAIGTGYGSVATPVAARTIAGALGLFYIKMEKAESRGAAVLLFLRKNYSAFGIPEDIARIESVLASERNKKRPEIYKFSEQDGPLKWEELSQIVGSLT